MTASRHPVAELVRDNLGVPVLHLYNLGAAQLKAIHETMLVNGDDPIHEVRSQALAHLGRFDSFSGNATIAVHGEDTGYYSLFMTMLAGKLDMHIPTIPAQDFLKTGTG